MPAPRNRRVNTVSSKPNSMKLVVAVRERRVTMSTNKKTAGLDMKALLSTLWIFVLFNIAFRDIHEILRPGFLEEVMTGTVNGVQMTEGFLLLGGMMMEIPIGMVLLSRVLPYRANRWANIIAGPIAIALIVVGAPSDLDDMYFAIIEVVSLLLIVWYAWKWPSPELSPNNGLQ
jgi:Family of unknown function (DUF6326)